MGSGQSRKGSEFSEYVLMQQKKTKLGSSSIRSVKGTKNYGHGSRSGFLGINPLPNIIQPEDIITHKKNTIVSQVKILPRITRTTESNPVLETYEDK